MSTTLIIPDGKDGPVLVKILYTNWRGETAVRLIAPSSIGFRCNDWHPEPQWLLWARDVEKDAFRDFALSGIKAWGQEAVDAVLATTTVPMDREALQKALTEITDAADKLLLTLPGHWHDDATIELTDAANDARAALSAAAQNDLYDVSPVLATGGARHG